MNVSNILNVNKSESSIKTVVKDEHQNMRKSQKKYVCFKGYATTEVNVFFFEREKQITNLTCPFEFFSLLNDIFTVFV